MTTNPAQKAETGTGGPGYRVVYGETIPMWEQTFPTMREARAFAKKHRSFGDIIFSIKKVTPGEGPQSLTAALSQAEGRP